VVEPSLSKQWFVSVKPLAEKAIAAVKDGRTRIYPKTWENTYFDWMYNIRDWCISRQIWWGHRIPAWTCTNCNELIVSDSEPKNCPQCQSIDLQQETDVLDTWFSSALWPFSTLGWPEETRELAMFYPTSVLITSFDILFFWVARMMMMGLHFMGEVPFRDVYLHARVRDEHGQKMSKSKGNVLDPLLVMDKYGTDALRFTMTAFAAQGRDIRLSEERIEGYRHFINKIWNAARFAFMHIGGGSKAPRLSEINAAGLALPHRWILSRTCNTIRTVSLALDEYRFNDAASGVYQFIWHEFCDWYLELIKQDLYGEGQARSSAAKAILFAVLETVLKLAHPIIPFVTEEIWHALPGERTSIMLEPFPEEVAALEDSGTEEAAEILMGVITGLRNIRSETGIHPSARIEGFIVCHDPAGVAVLLENSAAIRNLARVEELHVMRTGGRPHGAASYIYKDIEIFVPLAGLIDVEKELEKLAREKDKAASQLHTIEGKLHNEKFLAHAPEAVVVKEKDKQETLRAKLAKLDENIARLANL
jgi:valyl-tRNA synthetase